MINTLETHLHSNTTEILSPSCRSFGENLTTTIKKSYFKCARKSDPTLIIANYVNVLKAIKTGLKKAESQTLKTAMI